MSSIHVSNNTIFSQSHQNPCVRNFSLIQRSISSSIYGTDLRLIYGGFPIRITEKKRTGRGFRVLAMSVSTDSRFKMNLNEYMVTLEKPLGIRFALSLDGKILVHSMKKGVGICINYQFHCDN